MTFVIGEGTFNHPVMSHATDKDPQLIYFGTRLAFSVKQYHKCTVGFVHSARKGYACNFRGPRVNTTFIRQHGA